MKERVWVVPNNDLEAVTIIELLKRKGERVIITNQQWGASWEGLEPEAKELLSKEAVVYGVELQGDSPYRDIDHHRYGDDDRTNPKSSLEQVAEILEVDLSIREQFIAANDRGYIPAMMQLGKELGMNEEETQKMIQEIRLEERRISRITPEQEEQAEKAIAGLGDLSEKRKYIELDLPHSKTATVTDRLFGKYDELLIISADGETNFFGSTEIINMLNEKFPGGWSGGELDKGSGFWGGYADQEKIRKAVRELAEPQQSKLSEIRDSVRKGKEKE